MVVKTIVVRKSAAERLGGSSPPLGIKYLFIYNINENVACNIIATFHPEEYIKHRKIKFKNEIIVPINRRLFRVLFCFVDGKNNYKKYCNILRLNYFIKNTWV